MDALVTGGHPVPSAVGGAGERRARIRRRLAVVAAVAVGATVAGLGWQRVVGDRSAEAGARAFDGRIGLVARIDGHADPLPAAAAACANCHRPSVAPRRDDGTPAPDASLGPLLHRDGLLQAVERRGGPASRYDPQAFCRLLRTGEDPAGILLPRAMPRYDIDDAGCGQLWAHLLRTVR